MPATIMAGSFRVGWTVCWPDTDGGATVSERMVSAAVPSPVPVRLRGRWTLASDLYVGGD